MLHKGFTYYPVLVYFSLGLGMKLPVFLTSSQEQHALPAQKFHAAKSLMTWHQQTKGSPSPNMRLQTMSNFPTFIQSLQNGLIADADQDLDKYHKLFFKTPKESEWDRFKDGMTDKFEKNDIQSVHQMPRHIKLCKDEAQHENQDGLKLDQLQKVIPQDDDIISIIHKISKFVTPRSSSRDMFTSRQPKTNSLLQSIINPEREENTEDPHLQQQRSLDKRVITCQGWGASCSLTLSQALANNLPVGKSGHSKSSKSHQNTHATIGDRRHKDKHFQPFFSITSGKFFNKSTSMVEFLLKWN